MVVLFELLLCYLLLLLCYLLLLLCYLLLLLCYLLLLLCYLLLLLCYLLLLLYCPTINNSSSSTPGPPDISSQGSQLQEKVGSNITLPCVYTANPTVRITKWRFIEFTSTFIFMGVTSGHYSVQTYSLTVYNLTAADGGLYNCNVTNQCGSDQTTYHVTIIGNYIQISATFDLWVVYGYKYWLSVYYWAINTRQLHYLNNM